MAGREYTSSTQSPIQQSKYLSFSIAPRDYGYSTTAQANPMRKRNNVLLLKQNPYRQYGTIFVA
jgi:hypothetical protein